MVCPKPEAESPKPLVLVVGTRNKKKLREIETILESLPVELKLLDDFPDAPEVEEDADTFAGNATKKAQTLANALHEWVVADDSGLEIDALEGRPGVMSARYAGLDATDAQKCEKVLAEMQGVPREKRTARFRCVIALARPGKLALTVEGRCEGFIAEKMSGKSGFGYDPVFYYPSAGRTFADMAPEEKNRVSHRGKALALFREELGRCVLHGESSPQ